MASRGWLAFSCTSCHQIRLSGPTSHLGPTRGGLGSCWLCLGWPYILTQLWVWHGEGHTNGGGAQPLLTRRLCLFPVGHSMFENLNASLPPKPQSSHSGPQVSRSGPLGSMEPGGPGLWVGSSQHLRNLGKAMGAKVNDLLRRREPWGLGTVGAMEVNWTAEAQLASAPGGEDNG